MNGGESAFVFCTDNEARRYVLSVVSSMINMELFEYKNRSEGWFMGDVTDLKTRERITKAARKLQNELARRRRKMTLADSKWWYRIVADSYDGPRVLRERYAHPWEAELEMLKHCLSGWIQGFAPGPSRTYVRDWLRVDP